MSVFSMVLSGIAGARLQGRSPRAIIGIGLLLIGAGALISAVLIDSGSSWPALMPGYALVGAGVGLVMPKLADSAMAAVPRERSGMAAGSLTTARQLGFAIGIAVLGTVFANRAAGYLGDKGVPSPNGVAHGLAAGQAGRIVAGAPSQFRPALDSALHGAAASGLDLGFYVAGGVGLVAALAVFLLVRPTTKPAPATRIPEPVA